MSQWGLVLRARDEESLDIGSFGEQARVVVVQLSTMTMPGRSQSEKY
jgi:hypothetical protein